MMTSTSYEPRTKLSQASFEGNLAGVNHLLDSDVDYLEVDESGRTALHWAVAGHHSAVVERLIAHHRDKSSSSPSKPIAIHTLTYEELKRLALSVRPRVTPIELAAQVDDKSIFKVLLEHIEPFADTTILLNGVWPPAPCAPPPYDHEDILSEQDLAQNTSIPSRHADGSGLDWQRELLVLILHLAIKDDRFAVAEMALRLGADPGAPYGKKELLALHVAVKRRDLEKQGHTAVDSYWCLQRDGGLCFIGRRSLPQHISSVHVPARESLQPLKAPISIQTRRVSHFVDTAGLTARRGNP
jgi:Ankyrin repeats (3 copies)